MKDHCEEEKLKRWLSSEASVCITIGGKFAWHLRLSLAACSSILSHNCKDFNALGGWNFQVTCFIAFFTTIQKAEILHTDQASRSHIRSEASTGAAWGRALLSSRLRGWSVVRRSHHIKCKLTKNSHQSIQSQ